ncbi:MAG TPA: hypothetical protein VFG37_16055 [Planctomycetota bacterium]|jgi:hypothetical protein|nr:hypothetical protein [Planctomycetota bacterium]
MFHDPLQPGRETRQPAWLVLSEECDAATLRADFLELTRSDRSDPELAVIVDFRRTSFPAEPGDAVRVADALAQPTRFLRSRIALVAEDEAQRRVLGFAAMLCALRGDEAKCFDDFELALTWLDGAASLAGRPRPEMSTR